MPLEGYNTHGKVICMDARHNREHVFTTGVTLSFLELAGQLV